MILHVLKALLAISNFSAKSPGSNLSHLLVGKVPAIALVRILYFAHSTAKLLSLLVLQPLVALGTT
jgi:hypothetical protein